MEASDFGSPTPKKRKLVSYCIMVLYYCYCACSYSFYTIFLCKVANTYIVSNIRTGYSMRSILYSWQYSTQDQSESVHTSCHPDVRRGQEEISAPLNLSCTLFLLLLVQNIQIILFNQSESDLLSFATKKPKKKKKREKQICPVAEIAR